MTWAIVGPPVVYVATCLTLAKVAHRWVLSLRAPAVLFLVLAPLALTGKALLTGGVYGPIDIPYQAPPLSVHAQEMRTAPTQSPILSDVAYQEIPWRKAVRDAFKNGRLPLWNRFVLAGEPLLAVQQPVVLHPATWLSMLFPLAQAWTFDMTLRYFTALFCAYLFLRDLKCGEIPALFGAVAWAFCDYVVFWVGYPLTPAVAPMPLLLLGLRRLVSRADTGSVVLTVIALLLITTSGHPETLLHCVAGAGLYFLFELASAGRGRRLRPLLLALLAGGLTLGMAAVLLLPLLEALPQTVEEFIRRVHYAHSVRSLPVRDSLQEALLNVMPYRFGVPGEGNTVPDRWQIAGYAGAIVWPLAALGLAQKTRIRWPLLVMGLLGIAAGARFPGVADLLAALPVFKIALNERMVFLAAFALAALAALGLDRLLSGNPKTLWAAVPLATAIGIGFLAISVWPGLRTLGMPEDGLRLRMALQIAPLILLTGLCLAIRRMPLPIFGCCVLGLLLTERFLEERRVYPTYPNKAFYPPLSVFEKIPRGLPYRFAATGFSFIPNIGALYELEDVRGYEAMTFGPLYDTSGLWCVPQPVWFNRVDDPTKPFLSFLNMRWVYEAPGSSPPAGWPVIYRGEEGLLLENPAALPRAFVPRELAYEPDSERQVPLLSDISDFSLRGVVGELSPSGPPAGPWRRNGEASVKISSYLPQRMTLDVEAREPAVVATSTTSWAGWKLEIDGARAPLLNYNHAFLGFRVHPGRHTAVLFYRPNSFVTGLEITLGTLVLSAWLSARAWRAKGRRSSLS